MTASTDIVVDPGVQAPAGWEAGTWTIDPAHTVVSFAVRHLMSRVRGTFREVSGQIVTTPEVSGSTAAAVVGVSSVSTGQQMRDDHLRSADFFEAEAHSTMKFEGRALRPVNAGWVLAGELTIRGVTRPVDFEVEFLGTDPDGLQGEPRIGFAARATISRRDFGIAFGLASDARIVVADKVDIALDVQAFRSA